MIMQDMAASPALSFASDYMEGAQPAILQALLEHNLTKQPGYGIDPVSEHARQTLRAVCQAPDAEIHFLTGGTQTNATVIGAALPPWQGVIAAQTGHVSQHEAGAIEAGGHKVLSLPHEMGKLTANDVRAFLESFYNDDNHAHMVEPGMVYISQPTEYGTLYSMEELTALSTLCRAYHIPLYVDGARLAYALACPENDVTLPDLAHLADVFYIGGTKCGALFGEAVLFPGAFRIPHFFTQVKQHGALLAKGFVCALQFDVLFTDDLYRKGAQNALLAAERIRSALREKGYRLAIPSPTNQIFLSVEEERRRYLEERVQLSFWEQTPDGRTTLRIATSWATKPEDVDALVALL